MHKARAHSTSLSALLALLLAIVAAASLPSSAFASEGRFAGLEKLALSLLNCARTGGWVEKDGSCTGFGSAKFSPYRPPLVAHDGLATRVARPYAMELARADACEHTLAGSSVEERFRDGGYGKRYVGESVACGSGWAIRKMVIETHRMMQAEMPYDGPHWRNMKNPDFSVVGVGVAAAGRQTRVVYDFMGRR
jgi:hypothetical protein